MKQKRRYDTRKKTSTPGSQIRWKRQYLVDCGKASWWLPLRPVEDVIQAAGLP